MKFPSCLLAAAGTLAAVTVFAASPPVPPDRTKGPARPIDYTREVRPILAGRCFRCHGPDDKARKAGLRLDTRDGAIKKLRSGDFAIVPGDPNKSELLARIVADDDAVMPPPKAGKRLSQPEVETLRAWIAQGASYAAHWSYVKPVRPNIPALRDPSSARNPIDRFILARLDKEGLKPTPQADRAALLRRVALDLTGLPPTIEMADRYLRVSGPDAYEKAVDELLASPAFGERWAASWLDLARYADSQGYANDPDRTIWRWRDWVIGALNANMPYDQFTIEQLAGDLLPKPTTEQLIATGFHRNTLTNTEGGTSPEEFRSAAVVDRVNTTLQVWMGTTIGCAQCHNHKYDPFSQKEYYQLYAIFNNTEDRNAGDDFPTLRVAAVGREDHFARLTARLERARKILAEETKKADSTLARWEEVVPARGCPSDIYIIVNLPQAKRTPGQKQRLLTYHRSQVPEYRAAEALVRSVETQLKANGTTTPILREGKSRETHVHIRGNFLDKGERVQPELPAALHQAPAGAPLNRLTLARWLVDANNPLTARVAVNRLWEELFGVGLVQTSEEFGLQGELPSHPELLDYLAVEYLRGGWDTKRLLRLIVTSATYRQGSQVSAELNRRDPFNRLLARGPRLRLSAEAIRDQALFMGGLLSTRMYGPPVQPPRPIFGLAAAFGSSTDWKPSQGEDRHRRALYTRWRRNAPYPSATTFDAPERTVCNVRRVRTNTPLQALVTLNDPVFVEAAQGLARRIAAHGGDARQKVNHAFRLCLTRSPRQPEADRLVALYERARKELALTPQKAVDLATNPIGPLPAGRDAAEVAAWTVVGNVLLNLDETLARR
jgi:mono/diheme cytochrome c family protein